MFRKTTTLAMRQRITPCARRRLRLNAFSAEAEDNIGLMTTYSAFDPCSFRPLPLPRQRGMVMQMPTTFSESAIPDTQRGVETTTEQKQVFKPWPYSLPSFLQPKDGTTFSLMNGTPTTATPTNRTGVLQAILYGVPDPERFSYMQEMVAPGSLLDKILHGVKEMDDGENVVAVASVTAVELEQDAIAEEAKVGNDTRIMVVKNVQVKVEVENVLEKNDDMGEGMIAK